MRDLLTASWDARDVEADTREAEIRVTYAGVGSAAPTRRLLHEHVNHVISQASAQDLAQDSTDRALIGREVLDALGEAGRDIVLMEDVTAQLAAFGRGHAIASTHAARAHQRAGASRVELSSGSFIHEVSDLRVRGAGMDFTFRRVYNSGSAYIGPLGARWQHPYNLWLRELGDDIIRAAARDLREDVYTRHPQFGQHGFDYWSPPQGRHGVIVARGNSYVWRSPSGPDVIYEPDPNWPTVHRAARIVDRFNNYLRLRYDADGRVSHIDVNHSDRYVLFTYEDERLHALVDHTGRRWTYSYDGATGDLLASRGPATRRCPRGCVTAYIYNSRGTTGKHQHKLLEIVNADGRTAVENVYSDNGRLQNCGRVVRQRIESGEATFEYEQVVGGLDRAYADAERPHAQVNCTDRSGHRVHYVLNRAGDVLLREEYKVDVAPRRILQWRYRYNPSGDVVAIRTPEGRIEQHLFEREYFAAIHGIASEDVMHHPAMTIEHCLALRNRLGSVRRGTIVNPAQATAINGEWGNTFPDIFGPASAKDVMTKWTYEPHYQQETSVSDTRFTKSLDPGAPGDPQHIATLTRREYGDLGTARNAVLRAIKYPATTRPDGNVIAGASEQFTRYDARGRLCEHVDQRGTVYRCGYFDAAAGVRVGYLEWKEQDPAGLSVRVTFDVDHRGNLTAVHHPRSIGAPPGEFVTKVVTNAVDEIDEIEQSAPFNFRTRAVYDYAGRPSQIERELRDADGAPLHGGTQVQWFAYDAEGNRRIDAIGGPNRDTLLVTRCTYDAAGRVSRVMTPEGRIVRHTYDGQGRDRSSTRGSGTPEASRLVHEHDGDGNVVGVRSALGHQWRLEYDELGRVTSVNDPLGNVTRRTYDKAENLTVERTFQHRDDGAYTLLSRTEYNYDERSRRVREVRNLFLRRLATSLDDYVAAPGPGRRLAAEFFFDPAGQLKRSIDPSGRQTVRNYDALGRQQSIRHPGGARSTFRYDEHGHLVRRDDFDPVRDASGAIVDFEAFAVGATYDQLDRCVSRVDALGNTQGLRYDSAGHVTHVTDPLGNIELREYDVYGRLTTRSHLMTGTGLGASVGNLEATIALEYDADGNVVALRDGNSNRTMQQFDSLQRRTGVVFPDGTFQRIVFDSDDNVRTLEDANGCLRKLTPDARGRVVRIEVDSRSVSAKDPIDGETYEKFSYDAHDRLTQEINDFASIVTTYDSCGRPRRERTAVVGGPPASAVRTYSDSDDVESLRYPSGRKVVYHRDRSGRVATIENLSRGTGYPGALVGSARYELASFAYHGSRRIEARAGNGVRTVFGYDGGGRLIDLTYTDASGAVLGLVQQLHDGCNNVRIEMAQLGGVGARQHFSYDSRGRLLHLVAGQGMPINPAVFRPPRAPVPDPIPDRQQQINVALPPLRLPQPPHTVEYDPADNRLVDRLARGASVVYVHNNLNQYVSVGGSLYRYDGNGNLRADGARTYGYDARDLLTTLRDETTGAVECRFAHDARGRRVLETTASGGRVFHFDGPNLIEERDAAGLVVLSQYVHEAAPNSVCHVARAGTECWVQRDLLDSTRLLTGNVGAAIGAEWYDAFGEPVGASNLDMRLRFQGRPYDGRSLHDVRAREYSSATGRFLQRDPRGAEGGGNLYQHAHDNPLRYVDPHGSQVEPAPGPTGPPPVWERFKMPQTPWATPNAPSGGPSSPPTGVPAPIAPPVMTPGPSAPVEPTPQIWRWLVRVASFAGSRASLVFAVLIYPGTANAPERDPPGSRMRTLRGESSPIREPGEAPSPFRDPGPPGPAVEDPRDPVKVTDPETTTSGASAPGAAPSAESWFAAKWEQHHVFAKEFERWFPFNIHESTVTIPAAQHRAVHRTWNQEWLQWIWDNPSAGRAAIEEQAARMMERGGLLDKPLAPYRR